MVMVIVKKFHQLLQPLQHRTGRTTTWISEGCHKVLTTLSRHFFFVLEMFKLFDTLPQRKRSVTNFLLQKWIWSISLTQIPFSVWSAQRTSRYLRMTKRDPCRRDWNMIIYSYVCWGNVVSVWQWEKAWFFFKLRSLLSERICFNGPVLAAYSTACWF